MTEEEMRKEENLEHEVIDRLKNLEFMDFDFNAVDSSYVDAMLKARNIILDLYNKQKEEINLMDVEFNRLEDIEDRKVQVEIENIENRRDKYWKDAIREKIKYLEDLMILFTNDKEKFNRYKYTRDTLDKLLEE